MVCFLQCACSFHDFKKLSNPSLTLCVYVIQKNKLNFIKIILFTYYIQLNQIILFKVVSSTINILLPAFLKLLEFVLLCVLWYSFQVLYQLLLSLLVFCYADCQFFRQPPDEIISPTLFSLT